jgi:hypothetical protein
MCHEWRGKKCVNGIAYFKVLLSIIREELRELQNPLATVANSLSEYSQSDALLLN